MRMMTFVIKEQLVSKVGAQEGVGNSCADLWNMPLAEKKETGNIYTELTLMDKERSTSSNGYDTVTLCIPRQGDDFLPNFRRGDMVYLYAYRKNEEPDVRKSILFKGSLQEIHSDRIVVHLSDGQQNPDLISGEHFAIEHAGSDIGGTSAIRSLYTFITSETDRRRLLLGQRAPRVDKTLRLSRGYHPGYDEILLKAKQAQDYFLLIGPPGTGKTAVALHRAAYLLYVWREFLSRTGVLILGPNSAFLEYISQVLPELGETGVVLSTVGELFPGVVPVGVESVVGREVKGSVEMVTILARAVRRYQVVPDEPVVLVVDGVGLEPRANTFKS